MFSFLFRVVEFIFAPIVDAIFEGILSGIIAISLL